MDVKLIFLIPALWIGAAGPGAGSAQDAPREFFEWGEYDSLLVALEKYFARPPDSSDSTSCRYLGYRGVACFAKGNIAEAQRLFQEALSCDQHLALDSQYVTPEMLNLFSAEKKGLERELERKRRQDSLSRVEAAARQSRAEHDVKTAALTTRLHKNSTSAAIFLSLGVIAAGGAGYEYWSGRETERNFMSAAAQGDREQYDRYKTLLKEKNLAIIGCIAASAITSGVGLWFSYKSLSLRRERLLLQASGGNYELVLSGIF